MNRNIENKIIKHHEQFCLPKKEMIKISKERKIP